MKYPTLKTTKTARLFVQNGTRPRNAEEARTRYRAYQLKAEDCRDDILAICAEEMAQQIEGEDCILIPVPDSKGDTRQNLWLAHRIAESVHTGKVEVRDVLTRQFWARESQCQRHRAGLAPMTPEEMGITIRPHKLFDLRPIYYVDNVITSGATIQACHDALGFGTGLVYAEAMRGA